MTATLIAVFDARRDGVMRLSLPIAHEMCQARRERIVRLSRAIAYLTYRLYRRAA